MAKLTQKAILQTFEAMLREMPFDKITVSALVNRCGISPNTFYYHYQDIYALLDQWLKIWMTQYPEECHLGDGWKTVLKAMLHEMQDNPEITKHVIDSIPHSRLEHYIFHTMENSIYQSVQLRTAGHPISEETGRMLASAFCYSLYGSILKFIHDGMQGDVEAEFDPLIHFLDISIGHYVGLEISKK